MLWYRVQLRNKPFCTMSSTGSGGNTNGNYPVSFSVLRELWCFAGRIGSSSLKTMEGDCLSCMKYLMFLFNFFIFVSIWNQLSVLHPRVSSSLLLPSRTQCNLVKLPEDALSFALAITKVVFFLWQPKMLRHSARQHSGHCCLSYVRPWQGKPVGKL